MKSEQHSETVAGQQTGVKRKRPLWKKAAAICGAVIVGAAAAGGIAVWNLWGNEIRTLASFHQILERDDDHQDGSVYQMTVAGNYYFDKFLEQGGASSDKELISFITSSITKGLIPMDIGESEIACSAFTAQTETGDWVFGRNYDFSKTNTCLVYTNPGHGRHASVSTIDLQFLGIDTDADVTSLMDKINCLAAPFVPLDGVNDAGVSCGIFMSYQGETTVPTAQDTEKPDLTSTTMLRLILDYAGSVEEAVDLVSQYDLHDSANTSYHYMIADATGRSAVLEWVTGTDSTDNDGAARKLNVVYNDTDERSVSSDWQCVTNFILTPGYYNGVAESEMKGLDRYDFLQERLKKTNGTVADEAEAMELLSGVGRRTWKNDDKNGCTVHSVVYNLTQKTAVWTPNEHYGEDGYTFELSMDGTVKKQETK